METIKEKRRKEEEANRLEMLRIRQKSLADDLNQGQQLYTGGSYEQALVLFKRVLEMDPMNKTALEYKALCDR